MTQPKTVFFIFQMSEFKIYEQENSIHFNPELYLIPKTYSEIELVKLNYIDVDPDSFLVRGSGFRTRIQRYKMIGKVELSKQFFLGNYTFQAWTKKRYIILILEH